MNKQLRNLTVVAFACVPAMSQAWCERHLSIEEEFRASAFVGVGRVISDRETPDPPKKKSGAIPDPGHTYSVEVIEVLAGPKRKTIDLFTEYNSGQFPMDIGKSYLIFARPLFGAHLVSSCGNSGELGQRTVELSSARRLAQSKR